MNVNAFVSGQGRGALLLIGMVALFGTIAHAAAAPIAWAVGASGTILVSTDFGTTWAPQASGTSQHLLGVDFLDPTYGVAVGASGTLIRTIDGGVTWTAKPSGVGTTLHDVVLSRPITGVTVAEGIAIGDAGNASRTLDGGATWTPIVLTSPPADLQALGSTGTTTVIAVGNDARFARSNDQGLTWSPVATTGVAVTPPLNWLGVTGIGGTEAVAVGADPIGGIVSRYNGTAWSPGVYIGSFALTPMAAGNFLSDVAFTGATIVAVGLGGVVTRSTNGGFDWTAPMSVAPFDLLDVEFFDAMRGLAVGAGGNVIRTLDGGMTWSAPINATDMNLYALSIVDLAAATVPEPPPYVLAALAIAAMLVRRWLQRERPA